MNTVDLLLHPVRLRIVHALSGARELTITQLRARLPDVSKVTMYRQVALLAEERFLEVAGEQRVHGATERRYRLRQDRPAIDADAAAAMTLEEHRRGFAAAMAVLIAEFNAYLDREGADPADDRVSYRQGVLWLSPAELAEMTRKLLEVLRDAAGHEPAPGRAPYLLSPVLFPAAPPETVDETDAADVLLRQAFRPPGQVAVHLACSAVAGLWGLGQTGPMNERVTAQLRVIKAVVNALEASAVSAWLFGGWGLDARIGRITREHGDVEFWVERADAERSKAVLVTAGATALATQPPEEACEFTWDGVDFSTAYFDRQPDGSSIQLLGRWSDWLFPPGSFGDEPGTLDGMPVPAMSVAGMLAMKEQYPRLRNGGPWRQKDIDDIKVLRGLARGLPWAGS